MKTTRVIESKITVCYCDLCDISKEMMKKAYNTCIICERDICYNHTASIFEGDYDTKYCVDCFKIRAKSMEIIERIERKSDREIENEHKKWVEEAQKANKKGGE